MSKIFKHKTPKTLKKYLFFVYMFLFLAVYNVFRGNRNNYELMFIVSGTQFLLYYIKVWINIKSKNYN